MRGTDLQRISGAFFYPFRKGASQAWVVGIPLVLLLPLGAVPLLGYCVAVVRSSVADPDAGLPPWRPFRRLLQDGLLLGLAILLFSFPFALLLPHLSDWLRPATGRLTSDPFIGTGLALVFAGAALALPWGILLLVMMPPATAGYAASAAPRRLFDPLTAIRLVGTRFPTWNLVVAAIVSAWAIGLCGLGMALIGVVPGLVYALLVSARATAILADA